MPREFCKLKLRSYASIVTLGDAKPPPEPPLPKEWDVWDMEDIPADKRFPVVGIQAL